VWITGASSGIGEGLIAPLVARGARLAISARRGDALETIAAGWRAKGADVRAFPLDVTDRAAVERTVAAIEQAFGGIDVAILNAGGHLPGSGARFDGQQYVDKGAEYYERRNRQRQIEFLRKKAAKLGLQVTLACP